MEGSDTQSGSTTPSPSCFQGKMFFSVISFPSLQPSGGHKGFCLPKVFSPITVTKLRRSCLSQGSLLHLIPLALYTAEKGFTPTGVRLCVHTLESRGFCAKQGFREVRMTLNTR